MVYYRNAVALENIPNNTICVKNSYGIRNMCFYEDIEKDLVWVNQCEHDCGSKVFVIPKGVQIRYCNIHVSPAMNNFLDD